MDEFQAYDRLSEMEILKRTQPSWAVAKVEPFLTSPQQDVTPPEWNKLSLEVNPPSTTTDNSIPVLVTLCINGQPGYAILNGQTSPTTL